MVQKHAEKNNVGSGHVSAQSAITLIALIITVIILLILAGVTINLTIGENGIFKTAAYAKEMHENESNKESSGIKSLENMIESELSLKPQPEPDPEPEIDLEPETDEKYFIWELNEDGKSYSIIGLTDEGKTLSVLSFPNMHNDLPVTDIKFCVVGVIERLETETLEEAFDKVKNTIITTICIPQNVKTIQDAAFTGCASLEEILVDSKNGVFRSIDGVLLSKNGEKMYQYPYDKKSKVYQVPSNVIKFTRNATYLATDYIDEFICNDNMSDLGGWNLKNAKKITIGQNFSYEPSLELNNLEEIAVNSNVTNYTTRDKVLYSKDMKRIARIPSKYDMNNFVLPNSVTTIGQYAYNDNVDNLIFGDNVTKIEENAFFNHQKLEKIVINGKNCDIGDYCFANSGLKSLKVNSGASFGNSMMISNQNFQELILLGPIYKISAGAFLWCNNFSILVGPIENTEIIERCSFGETNLPQDTKDKILQINSQAFETGLGGGGGGGGGNQKKHYHVYN